MGVVPSFVKFLSYDSMQKLQFESVWALTNIASGNAEQVGVHSLSNGVDSRRGESRFDRSSPASAAVEAAGDSRAGGSGSRQHCGRLRRLPSDHPPEERLFHRRLLRPAEHRQNWSGEELHLVPLQPLSQLSPRLLPTSARIWSFSSASSPATRRISLRTPAGPSVS